MQSFDIYLHPSCTLPLGVIQVFALPPCLFHLSGEGILGLAGGPSRRPRMVYNYVRRDTVPWKRLRGGHAGMGRCGSGNSWSSWISLCLSPQLTLARRLWSWLRDEPVKCPELSQLECLGGTRER